MDRAHSLLWSQFVSNSLIWLDKWHDSCCLNLLGTCSSYHLPRCLIVLIYRELTRRNLSIVVCVVSVTQNLTSGLASTFVSFWSSKTYIRTGLIAPIILITHKLNIGVASSFNHIDPPLLMEIALITSPSCITSILKWIIKLCLQLLHLCITIVTTFTHLKSPRRLKH